MSRALPSTGRLRELIAALSGRRVLVFADLVADRFVVGRARRISREAPVLILEQESDTVVPGGGANAASNLCALGGHPVLLGARGNDFEGGALDAALRDRQVETSSVIVRSGFRTPTKTRVLGGSSTTVKQQIVRIDSGGRLELTEDELGTLRRRAAAELADLSPPRVAVLSDYGYGSVTPALANALRSIGPDLTILVDSRYRLLEFVGAATGATPNQEEAEAILGQSLDTDDAVRRLGPELRRRLSLDYLLITRGSLGMALFLEDRRLLLPVSGGDEVTDVTGAGDTVIGAFSLAIAAGAEPAEAAALANLAGGVVVHKQGTATAEPQELLAALDRDRGWLEELEWDAC